MVCVSINLKSRRLIWKIGYDDCNDGNATDEIGCPSRVCNGTNSMKCPNNNICIQRSYLCGMRKNKRRRLAFIQ